MDFQSAMETFAEAWVAANAAGQQTPLALTRPKSPCIKKERSPSPPPNRSSSGHSSPTSHHQQSKNLSGHQSLKSSPIPIVNENGLTPSSCRNTPIPLAMTPKISENGLHHQQHQQTHQLLQQQPQHSDKILQSPSIDRRDFDMSKVNSKSLPLHCVVESVHSLQASLNIDSRSPFKRRPNIEIDTYALIAASTQWSDIVSAALLQLGYTSEVANTARGSLIIKNWKPISLENICENPVVQVSEILGELTTIVTLRIVILKTKTTPFNEIKDKLLRLLLLQSHAVLRSTGCPLDEVTLSKICRSPYQNSMTYSGYDVSEDTKRKFDQWWNTQQSLSQSHLTSKILPFINANPGGQHDDLEFSSQAAAAAAAAAHAIASHHQSGMENHHHHQNQSAVPTTPTHPNPMLVHPALHPMHSHHHHHSGQFGNQKTRMRTSFDPEMELPKLQKWFQENPHPSRQQIQTYVVQLNSLESRRGRKPLDVNNVVYWFKNARAAQKRAEIRGGLGGNGYFPHPQSQQNQQQHHQSSQHVNNTMHMSTHDFLKSPISLKSEDIDDNISQHSDDLDEDNSCSRPSSPPQLPLSLTIHERNRSEDDSSVKDELSVNGAHESGGGDSSKNDINVGSGNTNSSCHNSSNHEDEVNRCEDNDNVNVSTHNQDEGEHNMDEHNNNNNSSNNNNNVDEKSNETSPKNSSKSEEDLDMDEDNNSQIMDDGYRSPSPDPRRDLPFPMVPNSMLQHSFMYMSHYMPGAIAAAQAPHHPHNPGMTPVGVPAGLNLTNMSSEERRKRNRTFIDPVTEVPKLEQWFAMNTHPSHNLILKYTEDLNRMPYRQKFPRLESKNVQFWFKNRRAKCKRLKMSLYDGPQCSQLGGLNPYAHHKYEERD